jgi:superfamily II DNA or RNA helicase
LEAFGIRVGIIMAKEPMDLEAPVQVASVQTLNMRAFRTRKIELPEFAMVFIDEAHHVRAATYEQIVKKFPHAVVVGLTATPCRGDGRGLGNVFEALIEAPQVRELQEGGHLVKSIIYAPLRYQPDLKGVRTQAGDYVLSQLGRRMDDDTLVRGVVEHWLRHGQQRPTVVFAVNVKHSRHIRDEFERAGVSAAHIDAKTPKEERDEALKKLADGEIKVLTNCAVLVEGWDCPPTSCCILARPTKQLGLYRQMVGRVLRPYPGKEDAVILDHSGAVYRHGFPEDEVLWQLHQDKKAVNKSASGGGGDGQGRILAECPKCHAVRNQGEDCHACGWKRPQKKKAVVFEEGNLAFIDRKKQAIITQLDKDRWLRELHGYSLERGYKSGWVAHKFREKFGHWPQWGFTPKFEEPSAEVLSWIRSRNIAWARKAS